MKEKQKLKLNFLIVHRDHEKKVIKFLHNNGYRKYFLFYGKGSASSAILEYLGIGERENSILLFPLGEADSIKLFDMISDSELLKSIIAFRVPLKGISSKKSLDYFLKGVTCDE